MTGLRSEPKQCAGSVMLASFACTDNHALPEQQLHVDLLQVGGLSSRRHTLGRLTLRFR